jgi:hypothetical protein
MYPSGGTKIERHERRHGIPVSNGLFPAKLPVKDFRSIPRFLNCSWGKAAGNMGIVMKINPLCAI